MNDFIIFSNVDDHPLAGLLKPGYRHVTAVYAQGEDRYVQIDWNGELNLRPIGGVGEIGLLEYYQEQCDPTEIIVRCTSRRDTRGTPFHINNCVGHTKAILGIRSWAITPWQLRQYLHAELRDPDRDTHDAVEHAILPGLGGGTKGQTHAANPVPPTATVKPLTPEEEADLKLHPEQRRRGKWVGSAENGTWQPFRKTPTRVILGGGNEGQGGVGTGAPGHGPGGPSSVA